MAQGDFTKRTAAEAQTAFDELFRALPKKKQIAFWDHAKEILVFLAAAKEAAPEK